MNAVMVHLTVENFVQWFLIFSACTASDIVAYVLYKRFVEKKGKKH